MAKTLGPRNKFDDAGNFIGTEEVEVIICDKTKIALNDGVCVYPGYVEVKEDGYYVYRSDDPNNEMDTAKPGFPTPERFKEWIERDKALKNRIAYMVTEGPFPLPEGAEVGTHFISINALNHWCADKLASQVNETVPTPEDLGVTVTDFASGDEVALCPECGARVDSELHAMHAETPEVDGTDKSETAALPDASTPLVEGEEPPVVDLTDEAPATDPAPEGATSPTEETTPATPDELPVKEETPIPSDTPADTTETVEPEVPAPTAGDGEGPTASEATVPTEGEAVSTSPDEGIIVPDVPVTEEIPRCPTCGFGSSSPEAITAHIASEHPETTPDASTLPVETAESPVQEAEPTTTVESTPVQADIPSDTAKLPCVTCDSGFASVPHACPNAPTVDTSVPVS